MEGSQLAGKQLCKKGVLVDTKLNMSWHYGLAAKKANDNLSCMSESIASRLREMILPLCPALVGAYLEQCVHFWTPEYKREMDILKKSPMKGHEDMEGPGASLT